MRTTAPIESAALTMGAMVHGIIIATMLTLTGDNGSGDQAPAPPQPPSHPAQVSMKAADWTLKQSPTVERIWGDWNFKHRGECIKRRGGRRAPTGFSIIGPPARTRVCRIRHRTLEDWRWPLQQT